MASGAASARCAAGLVTSQTDALLQRSEFASAPPPPEPEPPTEFHLALQGIRKQAENADIPEREALLSAIEVLEHHPYVWAALKLMEPS